MPTKEIKWDANVEVVGGPKLPKLGGTSMQVDTCDSCEFDLEAGSKDVRVDLQPSDEIRLLVISRSAVDPKEEPKPKPQDLFYKVNGEDPSVPLENHHIVIGYGASSLLRKVPQWLTFTNNQLRNVTISILVGRNGKREATPAQQGAAQNGNGKKQQPAPDDAKKQEPTSAEQAPVAQQAEVRGL